MRQAALRAGLPVRSVQGILEGHVPSIERAAKVARALGICFYIGAPEGETPSSSAEPELIGLLAERIMRTYEECGADITPRKAVELAVMVHNRIVAETEDRTDRLFRVGEYIAELRRRVSDGTA